MTEYKSELKYIQAPIVSVYTKLSNLENLRIIQENISNPTLREQILKQTQGKVTSEQLDIAAERLRTMNLTSESACINASPLGNVTLRIIETQPTKLIKLSIEGLPMAANIWIQLLPNGEGQCALRTTLGAELNFFLKQMIKGKLQTAVDQLANMLSMISY